MKFTDDPVRHAIQLMSVNLNAIAPAPSRKDLKRVRDSAVRMVTEGTAADANYLIRRVLTDDVSGSPFTGFWVEALFAATAADPVAIAAVLADPKSTDRWPTFTGEVVVGLHAAVLSAIMAGPPERASEIRQKIETVGGPAVWMQRVLGETKPAPDASPKPEPQPQPVNPEARPSAEVRDLRAELTRVKGYYEMRLKTALRRLVRMTDEATDLRAQLAAQG